MNYIFKINLLVFFCLFFLQKNQSQLLINEIFITNGSKQLSADYNYNNWIEFYNNSPNNLNTTGYFLSDDSANLKKWPLPAISILSQSHKALLLSGNSDLNFNIKADADKGILLLSNSNGEILDKIRYPKQFYNYSYGRFPDAGSTMRYFSNPSFEAPNNSDTLQERSKTITFSIAGGFYENPVSVSLINASGEGQIYYTIDATEPDTNSQKYAGPIYIERNTVIRARIIDANKMYGNIRTNTYIVSQRKPSLPALVLATDPKNLFNDTIGIYVAGTNGKVGNCSNIPVNWNQDWERSANIEYFDSAHTNVINQMVGIRIAGGCSRTIVQKSFALSARGKYGKDRIDYKFFNNRNFSNYNSVMSRTGANDWSYTLCRDAIMQRLTDRFMNLDHQSIQPAVIYINGEYYGLQYMYERSGEDLIEAKYGLKQDKIDLGERQGVSLTGNAQAYADLLTYVNTHDLSKNEVYNYLASQIDIDNFIEYNIFEIYVGNHDWPASNSKYWRRNDIPSKWRWILYDTDFGFGLYEHDASHKTLGMMLEINDTANWPNPEWATRLFRNLIKNAEFKRKFVNRFYAQINTTFNPEYIIPVIDSISGLIASEVPYHFERWQRNGNQWRQYLQELKDFAYNRPEIVRSHLRDLLGAGENINLSCRSEAPGFGYISIDSVIPDKSDFNGIFAKGSIVQLNFIPASGYSFLKAERIASGQKREIFSKNYTDTLTADVNYVLYFEKAQPLANIVFNEFATSNNSYTDEYLENDDWIEIYNNGNDTVELSGLYITDSAETPLKYRIPYLNGQAEIILPKEYKILWADNQSNQGPLHLNFKLKSTGETIVLSQKIGEDILKIDECTIDNMKGEMHSFGRMPNVSGVFIKLNKPSPMAANIDNLPLEISDPNQTMIKIWYSRVAKSIQIDFSTETNSSSFQLMDISGRTIKQGKLYNMTEIIGVQNMNKGIYLLTIKDANSMITKKLIID